MATRCSGCGGLTAHIDEYRAYCPDCQPVRTPADKLDERQEVSEGIRWAIMTICQKPLRR